jgi:hypothetical protein
MERWDIRRPCLLLGGPEDPTYVQILANERSTSLKLINEKG